MARILASAAGCAPPPKVLVSQNFHGDDKNVRLLLQDLGQVNQSTKQKVFSVLVGVCDVNDKAADVNCKDTPILDNVVPSSIY